MSPYPLDDGIQKLISTAAPGIHVSKAEFIPALDLKSTPNGYIYYDISECTPYHSSEGLAKPGDGETFSFMLDVACVAHSNAQRKSLATLALSALQPVVLGRRTQLTSYTVPGTGVFIHFLRLLSQEELGSLKTGQSNPDLSVIVLSFSGKATC